MIQYLKDQWLAVVITVIWLFFTLHHQSYDEDMIKKTHALEIKIEELKKLDHAYAKAIDSLSKIDTVVVTKIKTIKQKEYVQIKVIDSLPISGLQKFFSERYPKR